MVYYKNYYTMMRMVANDLGSFSMQEQKPKSHNVTIIKLSL
jgi:hypothetical protein